MPDTVRTLAAIQALLADNVAGDISAQDVRDMVVSAYSLLPDAPASLDPEDIYWSGSDAAAMTEVTISGSQTITERAGKVSVLFTSQAAADYNCLLQARTFAIGDSYAVPIRLFEATSGNITAAGVIFTDGTISTSFGVIASLLKFTAEQDTRTYLRHGALQTMTNTAGGSDIRGQAQPWIYTRLTYVAANTFRMELSFDGISWLTAGVADVTRVMTPTHVGVGWSKDGSTGSAIATFGPILKVA